MNPDMNTETTPETADSKETQDVGTSSVFMGSSGQHLEEHRKALAKTRRSKLGKLKEMTDKFKGWDKPKN